MSMPLEPFGVAEMIQPEQMHDEPATATPARLLVVDDDEDIREAMVDALGAMLPGFEVVSAPNGQSALKLARERRFDVVVTDYRMPDLDGLALAQDLRGRGRCRAVFLVTAFGDHALGEEAALLGVHLIHKPFDVGALAKRVQRAAERHRPAPAQA